VLDSELTGQATAAGAGIIQPWLADEEGPLYELLRAGALHYPPTLAALAEDGIDDVGYRQTGSMVVDRDAARLDRLEDLVRARAARSPELGTVTRLEPGRACDLVAPLAPGQGALHVSSGARVDGRLLRDGLLRAAQRHGAQVEQREARLAPLADGWAVSTDRGRVAADAVVVAAGAWVDHVLAPVGVRVGVKPQRGQVVHLRLTGASTSGWPSVVSSSEHHYLVAFDEGRVVVGATMETGSGYDPRPTAAGVRDVLNRALAMAPGLGAAALLETRVGLRPLADASLPVVGQVGGVPGLFVNTGYGAIGLTAALVAGSALARTILGEPPELDLTPYAPPDRA
jgi:D-amino-acid dehydrogenase